MPRGFFFLLLDAYAIVIGTGAGKKQRKRQAKKYFAFFAEHEHTETL